MSQHQDPHTYVTGKFDQLRSAVAHGDVDAASRIVDQVDADGYPAAAAEMDAGLARTSLAGQLAEPTAAPTAGPAALTMPEGSYLAYIVCHETGWWSQVDQRNLPDDGRPSVDVFAAMPGGGCRWEFAITEFELDRPALRLEIFDEGWEAFTLMAPFFAGLAARGYRAGWTLAQVRELLDSLGAVDQTERPE